MRRSHGLPVARRSGPGYAQVEQRLLVDDPDALQALEKDLVLVEERLVLVEPRRQQRAELTRLLLPARRDVLDHAADLEVARVEALAGGVLEQVEHVVALAAAPPEHRHGAEVERRGGEPEQVARDPVQLEVDDAQVLRARRHLEVEQALHRHAERHRVEVVREVVHPLDERDDLPVGLVLARLLDAGVDVADDRLHRDDGLALERQEQPQHAVRRRVVRPHVDREELVLRFVDRAALERDRLLALAVRDVQWARRVTHTSAASRARCR